MIERVGRPSRSPERASQGPDDCARRRDHGGNSGIIQSGLRRQGVVVPEGALPEFSGIYAMYYGKVQAYAASLLSGDEADDVAQEVFIKVGRSLGTLADPSKLGAWIYAITLNTVRDAVRKRAHTPDRLAQGIGSAREDEEGDSAISRIPDTVSPTPEEDAIRNEMVTCYLDYVKRLPPKYYEVYVLSEFERLSNDAIARRLSLSLGAVKIRLHRARAQLVDELRRNCRCYYNERGELMGEPKSR